MKDMRVLPLEDLPREFETIEHTWIPMRDGTRLAARIWLPVGAEERPVPAILEYIPYRKRDHTRTRDARSIPTSPRTGTSPCAWTCAAAATPKAC